MKRKILILLIMIPMIIAMASCGFVVEEESIQIESITHEVLEDGQIKVVISYTNEDIEPSIFFIPKGIDGEIGVGIENIEANDTGNGSTNFLITLSNGVIKEVEVPKGVSIADTKEITEDGVRYLVFQFTDGSEKRFELLRGEQGENGLSVVDIQQTEITDSHDEYFGYIKVTFTFSDGTEENTYFKDVYVRPGKEGNGIASVVESYDSEYYYITFYFSESGKEPRTLKFPIPQVAEWTSGEGSPSNLNGKNGDFYFDTKNGAFYKKVNNIWTVVCKVPNAEGAYDYLITLDKNAEDALLDDKLKYINVTPNTSIVHNGKSLPIPYRPGYTFVGWYATDDEITVNNGVFTDLTIVTGNITLYAHWVEDKE
jgi:uncharacterized repeat protein (TIGR02543 family)